MEAEELAVADPAVQHAVNMDVVGLRREGEKKEKKKRGWVNRQKQ